jgi:FkbM family methyltransferase
MFGNKILFLIYQSIKKMLGGKGLTKYVFIRKIKEYSLINLQTDYAEIFGNRLFLGKKGLAMSISHYGKYEETEAKIMEQKMSEGDIVIDAGANIGLHTLNMAKIVGKTGKVFAFEPEITNFEILKKNIKLNNYTNIFAEHKAVGEKDGIATLYRSNHPGMHKIDSEPQHSKDKLNVDIINLDNFFNKNHIQPKIDFIKIDVEGFELSVLKGMKNILKNNKNIKILLELYHNKLHEEDLEYNSKYEELLDFLESFNFKKFCIDEENNKLIQVSDKKKIIELCASHENTIGRNIFCQK